MKNLGNAFVAAKEKGDAEAVTRLRAAHETGIQKLLLDVRKLQLEEGKQTLDALQQSRKGPEYRLRHYLRLIGGDMASVPSADADFAELQNLIDTPVEESGLKISRLEKQELDKANTVIDVQRKVAALLGETLPEPTEEDFDQAQGRFRPGRLDIKPGRRS